MTWVLHWVTSYERDESNFYSARATNQASSSVPSLNLGIGDPTTKSVNEGQSHYAIGSYFGRVNYAYKANTCLRQTRGMTALPSLMPTIAGNCFMVFSGGWRVSQEEFMKNVNFLSDLKLRASYGTVGNQSGIGLYDYIQLLNVSSNTTGATNSGFPISAPAR